MKFDAGGRRKGERKNENYEGKGEVKEKEAWKKEKVRGGRRKGEGSGMDE